MAGAGEVWVVAKFDFEPVDEFQLGFREGDKLRVIQQNDSGWWEVQASNGDTGLIPFNYCDMTEPVVALRVTGSPPRGGRQNGNNGIGLPQVNVQLPEQKNNGIDLPNVGAVALKAERQSTSKPKIVATITTTKYGIWAANMALGSAFIGIIFGIGGIMNGLIDTADSRSRLRVIVGIYTAGISVATILYERTLGLRRGPSPIPYRGIVYLLLSGFQFASTATLFTGPLFVITAFVNIIAAIKREEYDLVEEHKPRGVERKQQEDHSDDNDSRGCCAQLSEENRWGYLFCIFVFGGANIAMFTYNTWMFWASAPASGLTEWVAIAKGFGLMLDFNCAFILLPVLRTMLRWLYNRSTANDGSCTSWSLRGILLIVPLDLNIKLHKLVAWTILFASIGHAVAHIVNYSLRAGTTLTIYGLWPWFTGGLIMGCMLIIYTPALENVKRGQFELFWYSHHFFVLFFLFTLIHGTGGLGPNYWKFFIPFGSLYALERLLRILRARKPVYLLSVTLMKPNLLCLEWVPPFGKHMYREGQYVFVNCPHISENEWHPFTISSAPQDENATLHIRVLGPGSWTRSLKEYLNMMGPAGAAYYELFRQDGGGKQPGKAIGPDGRPILRIDGPHAAPTQHVSEYQTVMLIGAGIGLTPMASTLRSIVQYRWRLGHTPHNVYFYWVCAHRDCQAFQWFIYMLKELEDEVFHLRTSTEMLALLEMHIYITSYEKDLDMKFDPDFRPTRPKANLQNVNKRVEAPFSAADLFQAMTKPAPHTQLGDIHVYNGRPDWERHFQAVANANPHGNIGVPFCGLPMIAKDLKKMCVKHSASAENRIFKLHKEVF